MSALAQEQVQAPLESNPVAESRQEQSATNSNSESNNNQQNPNSFVSALERIESAIRDLIAEENQINRERQQNQEIRDLNAQEEMAFWAKLMFWATAATVGVTFVGLFLIWRTLHHTRRAADYASDMVNEAKKTTEAAVDTLRSNRAWLVHSGFHIEDFLRGHDEHGGIHENGKVFRINWVNVGTTPALECSIFSRAKVLETSERVPTFDEDFTANDGNGNSRRTFIAPKQVGSGNNIQVYGDDLAGILARKSTLYIYARAQYIDVFDDSKVRVTECCFEVLLMGSRNEGSREIHEFNFMPIGPQNNIS